MATPKKGKVGTVASVELAGVSRYTSEFTRVV